VRKLKEILFFLVLLSLSQASFANPATSDSQVCSMLKEVVPTQVFFLDLAKERKLNCSSKFNFSIPENAHEDGLSWTCNTDYYKSGLSCRSVPANAYSSYDSNYWSCNPRYYKNSSRSGCRSVPLNGTKWADDYGFNCNRGYKKNSSGQSCTLNSTGSIPDNAHKDGTSWTCNTNYYKNTDTTCLKVPLHSTSLYDSNDFICNAGYKKKYGNSCVQITKPNCPENSHAVGDECRCDTGYKLNSNRNGCVIITTTPAPAKTTENNDGDLEKLIVGVIVAVVLWLIFKPSSSKPTPKSQPRQTPKSQPRQTPKSQPRSTPKPQSRSTSSSKYKPPIKPRNTQRSQPRSTPKPQPKQESRVGDLQPIFIKIDNSNCRELTKEFKEWNGKLLLVKTDKESKDIQKILSRIGKARMDKNC
jgi:hypothetical protein